MKLVLDMVVLFTMRWRGNRGAPPPMVLVSCPTAFTLPEQSVQASIVHEQSGGKGGQRHRRMVQKRGLQHYPQSRMLCSPVPGSTPAGELVGLVGAGQLLAAIQG